MIYDDSIDHAIALRRAIQVVVQESGRAQVLVAGDLGISQKHLSQIMNDRIHPRPALVQSIAKLFGVTFVLVISGDQIGYEASPSGFFDCGANGIKHSAHDYSGKFPHTHQ